MPRDDDCESYATILLVRHGRSAHTHDGSWIDHRGARAFIERYDAAPIRDDDGAPHALRSAASNVSTIFASDLPRAVTSARSIAPEAELLTTPLLRELPFDLPAWGPRLPLDLWDGLHHGMWTLLMAARANHAELRRARDAADWLESRIPQAGPMIVVTHGGFRRLITAELRRRGWRRRERWSRYYNWSVWTFSRAGSER
jgi:broad specificity phosphatase PhoE